MAFDDRLVAWADERGMGEAGREAVRVFGEDADTAAMAVADPAGTWHHDGWRLAEQLRDIGLRRALARAK